LLRTLKLAEVPFERADGLLKVAEGPSSWPRALRLAKGPLKLDEGPLRPTEDPSRPT